MAEKMTAKEITKLLGIVIGPTTAVGETNADERILANLRMLIDVANWCVDGVFQSSETMGRSEWSMHKVGYEAKCVLGEWRMWLEDVCGEAEAESPSPKPTAPVPVRDVYYVMTECDVKTGTVTYEPRERKQ